MKQINKIDYFIGVFLAMIIGDAKNVPLLFDGPNESRQVLFETNSQRFNIFIKYSTNKRNSPASKNGKRKQKTYWNINFTQNEYDRFAKIYKPDYLNCLVVICSTAKLDLTWIAAMEFEKAQHCLQNSTPGGIYHICVSRFGNAQKFVLTGVNFGNEEYETCDFDYSLFFKQ